MATKGMSSSGGVFHDTIKYWVCRAGKGLGYQTTEMEAKGESTNDKFIPDVVMRHYRGIPHRKSKVYVEIQKDINKKWLAKVRKNYHPDELIIIDLNKLNSEVDGPVETEFIVGAAYIDVLMQIENETLLPIPKKDNVKKRPYNKRDDDFYITTDDGKHIKKRNEWKYKRRKANE